MLTPFFSCLIIQCDTVRCYFLHLFLSLASEIIQYGNTIQQNSVWKFADMFGLSSAHACWILFLTKITQKKLFKSLKAKKKTPYYVSNWDTLCWQIVRHSCVQWGVWSSDLMYSQTSLANIHEGRWIFFLFRYLILKSNLQCLSILLSIRAFPSCLTEINILWYVYSYCSIPFPWG